MAHTDPTEPTTSALDLTTRSRRPDETDALGDAIAELAARIQAATYELLVMIRQFDDSGGWGQGFTSCAHWLNWRTCPVSARRCDGALSLTRRSELSPGSPPRRRKSDCWPSLFPGPPRTSNG